jgi:hypothetical protein
MALLQKRKRKAQWLYLSSKQHRQINLHQLINLHNLATKKKFN